MYALAFAAAVGFGENCKKEGSPREFRVCDFVSCESDCRGKAWEEGAVRPLEFCPRKAVCLFRSCSGVRLLFLALGTVVRRPSFEMKSGTCGRFPRGIGEVRGIVECSSSSSSLKVKSMTTLEGLESIRICYEEDGRVVARNLHVAVPCHLQSSR